MKVAKEERAESKWAKIDAIADFQCLAEAFQLRQRCNAIAACVLDIRLSFQTIPLYNLDEICTSILV